MPRVKIDYIVSFSSEDPDNQANNLLAWEVSKKKWLCSPGEPSCSVVLQLPKAVKISTVHIGAHHVSLVEVLVGKSEKPNDPFQVLVPSSIFLSPTEARKGEQVERVRSFSAEQLVGDAREQRWDRVRVVCSQPYNKHCKYGLSFVHIFEPEAGPTPAPAPPGGAPAAAPALPARLLALDTFSSDDEEFRPGELFARHSQVSAASGTSDTGAQIRQATSQALKNLTDSATKLVKTPINKTTSKQHRHSDNYNTDRQKETLMYTDDDDKPNAKIDKIVKSHNDKKEQEKAEERKESKKKDNLNSSKNKGDLNSSKNNAFKDFVEDDRSKTDAGTSRDSDKVATPQSSKKERDRASSSKEKSERESKKRSHSDDKAKDDELRPGPVSVTPHTLLAGAVFALSGYENPRRAALRDAALALGATYERDWSPRCTHLICAFPNTPKLKAVRASGAACIAVRGEWAERCVAARRLLPWRWFATEPRQRRDPPADWEAQDAQDTPDRQSDCDTDDEIEKVLRKQKKRRTDKSPTPKPQTSKDPEPQTRQKSPEPHTSKAKSPRIKKERSPKTKDLANISLDSDVAFVKDERIQGNITIDSDSDVTDEEKPRKEEEVKESSVLPDFFDGHTFVIDEAVTESGYDVQLLARYVKAYGGVVIDQSQLDEDSDVNFIISTCSSCRRVPGAARVHAEWVWRCHRDKRLCDGTEYAL